MAGPDEQLPDGRPRPAGDGGGGALRPGGRVVADQGTSPTGSSSSPSNRSNQSNPQGDRRILAIAIPALGALIAEPLFLLADSAIVGRLGTTQLAGLGVAGSILATAVNVFIFLAYGTTASVARRSGAGDRDGAIDLGIDAAWLATGIGVLVALIGWPLAPWLAGLFDVSAAVHEAAVTYLRWSLPGIPAMLLAMSQIGVLRGLHRARVTLVVAATGAVVNAGLNLLLVHGLGFGIAGSAAGTVITQLGMAVVMVSIVIRAARAAGRPLRPHPEGIRLAGRSGVPLFVRTVAMRLVLVATTAVAATLGAPDLAAHQVAANVWTLLALALDALAIAGQALTGASLGAGDVPGVRADTARMVRWGLAAGVLLGLLLLACASLLGPLFSPDPAVRRALTAALLVAAIAQPVAGYVFVLDGVLIGAGDGRFLAGAAVAQAVAFVPAALAVAAWAPHGPRGLAILWAVYAGWWMVLRALLLGWRARGDAWLVLGRDR